MCATILDMSAVSEDASWRPDLETPAGDMLCEDTECKSASRQTTTAASSARSSARPTALSPTIGSPSSRRGCLNRCCALNRRSLARRVAKVAALSCDGSPLKFDAASLRRFRASVRAAAVAACRCFDLLASARRLGSSCSFSRTTPLSTSFRTGQRKLNAALSSALKADFRRAAMSSARDRRFFA